MTGRVFRLLVRNWPLRLGALALAIVLYIGLVVSQNARVWPGQIPIEAINQPPGTFIMASLGDMTSVRYLAPVDVAMQVTSHSFVATADLSGIQSDTGSTPVSVPVRVIAPDQRIQVIGWEPLTVAVRLDPVVSRVVPLRVDRGNIPAGFTASDPVVDRTTVTVRGAQSLVARVAAAVARVSIDASGINVDSDVDLVAVDDRGDVVSPVNLEPSRVHVKIQVGEELLSRTVPVVPSMTGDLALGYSVRDVTINPLTVTVTGEASLISGLESITTAPVDIGGRSDDLAVTVSLAPPAGVNVIGSTDVRVRVRVTAESGSRSFGAGVVLVGSSGGRVYELSVPDVLVTLGGTRAALASVDPAQLAVTVDVTGLAPGMHSLPVQFDVPAGTTLVTISPSRVDVTVVAPATPSPTPAPTPSPTPTLTPLPEPSPTQAP
jgi:YbbR domain-containing protein